MGNLRGFAIAAAAGVFMAWVNAFDMGDAPLAQRLLYWVPLMMAGAGIGKVVGVAASRQRRIRESRLLLWATVTTVVALPTTLMVWGYTGLVFGARGLETLPYYFGAVLPVSAAMSGIMMLVNAPGAATHAPPAGAPAPDIRLARRLPAKIMGGAIWAVSAEDHYLRVHTSRGADMILMRLADAMAELEGVEGAQVHRSWWVAKDGVAEVKRDGARVTLVLKNGAEAPVSRPNVKALKAAGWF